MAQRLRAEGRRATLVVLSDIQGSGGDVHHSHSATFKNHNHKDQWIDVPLPLTSSLARSDSVDGLGQSIDVGCEGPVLSQNWIESTGSIRRYTPGSMWGCSWLMTGWRQEWNVSTATQLDAVPCRSRPHGLHRVRPAGQRP